MMEFTLTRVVLCVAGILVLGAILTPVVDMFEERDDTSYQEQSNNIASMIDTFYASDAYEMTISLDRILPRDCEMSLRNNVLTLHHGDRRFESLIDADTITDSESYGRGQMISLTKHDRTIIIKEVI